MPDIIDRLKKSCAGGAAAIRAIVPLQPIGASGDKVMPPTHEGGQYAFERRRVGGDERQAVLLDSVQSQANRFEECLLQDFRSGQLSIPVLEVVIPNYEPVTSLTAPHRIHDAIFRDSLYQGKRFRESEIGLAVAKARPWNATALYRYCPTALIFGTWDSQSGAGAGGAKFARALVSEIVALDAVRGVKSSSRIDPLGIRAMAGTVLKSKDPAEYWVLADGKRKEKVFGKKGTPSDINHGNILPTLTSETDGAGGVTFREAQQTTVLSFAQLRRLSFPDESGASSEARNIAGRAVLAALALHAVCLQWEEGYQLRSRCQLVTSESGAFEWIGTILASGAVPDLVSLQAAETRAAVAELAAEAGQLGLVWAAGLLKLEPQEKLLQLVAKSEAAGDEAAEV